MDRRFGPNSGKGCKYSPMVESAPFLKKCKNPRTTESVQILWKGMQGSTDRFWTFSLVFSEWLKEIFTKHLY